MEKRYHIRSKLYVKPVKSKFVFKIILDLCLFFFMLSGIIKIIFDGISIHTVGLMCLAVIIVSAYRANPKSGTHYEVSLAEIVISSSQIKLVYHQIKTPDEKDTEFEIDTDQITALEYSDRLCCLRIGGSITQKHLEADKKEEFFLYLEKGSEQEILKSIQEVVPIQITYMDRMDLSM